MYLLHLQNCVAFLFPFLTGKMPRNDAELDNLIRTLDQNCDVILQSDFGANENVLIGDMFNDDVFIVNYYPR